MQEKTSLALILLLVAGLSFPGCISNMSRLAESGTEAEMRDAIKAGGNPNAIAGITPLHRAVNMGNVGAVRAMLENGGDITIMNNEGESPLVYAARQSRCEILKMMLEKKPDLNSRNKDGETILALQKNKPICNALYCTSPAERQWSTDVLVKAKARE